jgi:hypothetical protein
VPVTEPAEEDCIYLGRCSSSPEVEARAAVLAGSSALVEAPVMIVRTLACPSREEWCILDKPGPALL